MWLIQWAAENGLSWLVSDGTVLGFAAVHPAQFIVLALIFLAIGFMVGYLVRGKITSVEVAKINATAEAEIRKKEAFARLEKEKQQREEEENEKRRRIAESEEEEERVRRTSDAIRHLNINTKGIVYIMYSEGRFDNDNPIGAEWYEPVFEDHRELGNLKSLGMVDYETTHDGRYRWSLTDRAKSVIDRNPELLEEGRKYVEAIRCSSD